MMFGCPAAPACQGHMQFQSTWFVRRRCRPELLSYIYEDDGHPLEDASFASRGGFQLVNLVTTSHCELYAHHLTLLGVY